MAEIELSLNGKIHHVSVDPAAPLPWVLRDSLGLTGTKFGCGMGLCGACTVHLDGVAVRSCQTEVGKVGGRRISTIEGLAADRNHPLLRAWFDEGVPQCGYCQSGQIMQAAAFLAKNHQPSDEDVNTAMAGNICRCGTYQRIRRAIHLAAHGER